MPVVAKDPPGEQAEHNAAPNPRNIGARTAAEIDVHARLDTLVAAIVTAASRHDAAAVIELTEPEFIDSMVEDTPREELIASWQADPRPLDRLVGLLEGECMFFRTRDDWMCPRSLADPQELEDDREWGNAERVHFTRVGGRWRWDAFIVDVDPERSPTPGRRRTNQPSSDPLVNENVTIDL